MEEAPGIHAVYSDGRVWPYLYREGSRFTPIDAGIASASNSSNRRCR